jgi:hypothetical protein
MSTTVAPLPFSELRTNPALGFAKAGAQLLVMLAGGSGGDALRRQLRDTAHWLTAGAVQVSWQGGRFTANGAEVAPDVAQQWIGHLQPASVSGVQFAAHTSERELLLFAALLVAPGNASTFHQLWLDCGAWRIHPDAPGSVSPGGDDRVPSAHGAEATAVLLEALATTTNASRRRQLFDAIVAIGDGEQHLVAALDHPQWYVVRNAAALLGELRATNATPALVALIEHSDARVRAAAVTSLGQLQTDACWPALTAAVSDADARVRAQAWTAWCASPEGPPMSVLDHALRHDDTDVVKRAILDCTAAFPQLDVAGGLVRFCARQLTRRGTPDLTVYGVEQLALRNPRSAAPFVRRLADAWEPGVDR